MLEEATSVSAIVFDLDGTLYTNAELLAEIERTAELLVARGRGVSPQAARRTMNRARRRIADLEGREPTLSRVCMELGIELRDLHRTFEEMVRPEQYLVYDPVLQALLEGLREQCPLYLYTNNNLPLTQKILALLGIENLFERLFTIEYAWRPKPDPEVLEMVLGEIGGPPDEVLFVGDRDQVDLEPARDRGLPTLLVSETADLLQVHKLLGLLP
ncbi:MAG: HAD family hydrolase [Deltaproteobacteria bacterium]|nr:MAG: HAD family hydrolase [Deltaproteobacteria bacterium]